MRRLLAGPHGGHGGRAGSTGRDELGSRSAWLALSWPLARERSGGRIARVEDSAVRTIGTNMPFMFEWLMIGGAVLCGVCVHLGYEYFASQKRELQGQWLVPSQRGTVIGGKAILSPGRVACVGFGVSFELSEGEDGQIVTHQRGWTRGFIVRTDKGDILTVPEGVLELDGPFEGTVDSKHAHAYLTNLGLLNEKSFESYVVSDRVSETRIEQGQQVTIFATKFAQRLVPSNTAPRAAHAAPYRDGGVSIVKELLAQGRVAVYVEA